MPKAFKFLIPLKRHISIIAFLFFVLIDQSIKFLLIKFNLYLLCNSGFSFGIANFTKNKILFLLPILILGFVFLLYRKENNRLLRFAYLMIIAGGFSNLIDRLVRGCVVDFIYLGDILNLAILKNAFNFADILIFLGIVIVIYKMFIKNGEK